MFYLGTRSCGSYCFKTDLFFLFCFFNQLGKVNELIIKTNLSDLTDKEEDEDDVVEKSEEKEAEEEQQEEETSSYRADCVYTATSLDSAFNTVIEKHFSPALHSE